MLKSEEQPSIAYKINVEAVKNITRVCNENESILIHISTDYVFDGRKKRPYVENDKANPVNVYGMTKYLGEPLPEAGRRLGSSWRCLRG